MKKIIRITSLLMALVLLTFSFAACGKSADKTADEPKQTAQSAKTEDTEDTTAADTKRYSVTFYADEVPAFVADSVKKSMKIYDSNNGVDIGLITEALVEDSVCYASDAGKLILTTKTGCRSLLITATVEAVEALEGWYIGGTLYGIGHKDTLHVGNTEVELTLRSFEALD